MLGKMLEIGKIEILLISEEIPYEQRKAMFDGTRIVLTKGQCTDLGEEEKELRKYQSADRLIAFILEVIKETTAGYSYRGSDNKNKRIIGIYSPVHKIGKTTLTLKLGKTLSEEEKVLYLNLENYAGIGSYFKETQTDLLDLLYYAKQEQDDISVRIASMLRKKGDLEYVPPAKVWTDLREVPLSDWKDFFLKIERQCCYDTILLDIEDTVNDVFGFLKLCDIIVMPYTSDPYSGAKIRQYEYVLKALNLQELSERTIPISLDHGIGAASKEVLGRLNDQKGRDHSNGADRTDS